MTDITIDLAPPRRPITVRDVPEGMSKAQVRQRLLQSGSITLEDIGQQTAAPGVSGPFQAAMVEAGSFLPELGTRLAALGGDERALADVAEQRAMMQPMREQHPIASMAGGALQAPVPGGPLIQAGVGAVMGALETPESPGMGAAIGGTFGGVGARLGDVAADRAGAAISRLRSTGRAKAQQLARQVDFPLTRAERALTEPGAQVAAFFDRQASTVLGRAVKGPSKQASLNKTFARALGVGDAAELTGDVLNRAARKHGAVFESVSKNVDDIPLTESFSEGLAGIEQMAADMVPNARAMRQLERVTNAALSGNLTGKQYLRLRSEMGRISRTEWRSGGDQVSGEFLDELIGVLDQALAEAAPEYVSELADARSGWRLLQAVRSGAALDPQGNVNPLSMARALERTYPGLDLGRFADGAIGRAQRANLAASAFPAFRSSGTAERSILSNVPGMAVGLTELALGGGSGSLAGGSLGTSAARPLEATADALTAFLAEPESEDDE